MKYGCIGVLLGLATGVFAQPSNDSLNMRALLHYPVSQWGIAGAHADCADIWGYADSATGTEYAIIGNRKGTLVANITTPSSPSNALWVPGTSSLWRDIKTWDHYAYVVHDVPSGANPPYNGLLIIDMDSLAQNRWKFLKLPVPRANGQVDTLARAHNIFVDENGILYAFGSNVGVGGAILIDVATDPWNPVTVGLYDGHYFHDGVARNDTLYGAALYSGVVVVNVTLKSNPQAVTSWATPSNFAHNCWLSDDGNTIYTTDEVANGYITGYDISDLSNVDELWRHQVQPNTSLIPHNAHVAGNQVVTSYYTFGGTCLGHGIPRIAGVGGILRYLAHFGRRVFWQLGGLSIFTKWPNSRLRHGGGPLRLGARIPRSEPVESSIGPCKLGSGFHYYLRQHHVQRFCLLQEQW